MRAEPNTERKEKPKAKAKAKAGVHSNAKKPRVRAGNTAAMHTLGDKVHMVFKNHSLPMNKRYKNIKRKIKFASNFHGLFFKKAEQKRIIERTIDALEVSKNHNLPESRVKAMRKAVWDDFAREQVFYEVQRIIKVIAKGSRAAAAHRKSTMLNGSDYLLQQKIDTGMTGDLFMHQEFEAINFYHGKQGPIPVHHSYTDKTLTHGKLREQIIANGGNPDDEATWAKATGASDVKIVRLKAKESAAEKADGDFLPEDEEEDVSTEEEEDPEATSSESEEPAADQAANADEMDD